MTSAARRALALLVEPPEGGPRAPAAPGPPLDVAVTGLSGGCGASTVAQGLRRELPGARVIDGFAPASVDVLVVVAGRTGLPVLARLVADRLRLRHESVVLVANRPEDPQEWEPLEAVCVPQSRFGVLLLARGRRAPGSFGAALRQVAVRVQGAAPGSA
ncbi:MAG TPA: hypothetical protein VFB51_09895 [Solirubrobacterales bacterium]|nr:hypothetical protein [Solirubrobacterales bacterium]